MDENNEQPKLSARIQYLIGALISVTLVVGYLLLTGEGG